jgi:hypothetical protein
VGGRVYVLLSERPTDEQTTDHTAELIDTLREQLAAEREANRENRRIIAALTQRIPEIGASPAQAGHEDAPESAQPRSSTPWWRRWLRLGR